MVDRNEDALIKVDNPIDNEAEDKLRRVATAASFARQLLGMDASKGLAVGVFGPWGSGKTSFMNLARTVLEKRGVVVLDFNPWMFSDSEQLVARFFSELSGRLTHRSELEDIGNALAAYGGTVVGAANVASLALGIPSLGQILGPILGQLKDSATTKGLDELRVDVEQVLRAREAPIVVVLDDVDRLTFEEIRHVFKLVRLTASFPNLVYVVLCDRHRVEQALAEGAGTGTFGQAYVEKIIQFPFDLPDVPRHLLEAQLEEGLTEAVPGMDALWEEQHGWSEIYEGVVAPLIGNMRDVRRYAAAVRVTVQDLSGKVALGDVLGLEAVRLFVPAVFKRLHGAVDALTYPSQSRTERREHRRYKRGAIGPDPRSKKHVRSILKADKRRKDAIEAMVRLLFPYGDRVASASNEGLWEEGSDHGMTADRRVADEAILRLYLERVEGDDALTLVEAENLLDLIANDVEASERFLRSRAWEDLVSILREFCKLSGRYQRVHAEGGVPVLLNRLSELPHDPNDPWPRRVVVSAVYRLLRAVGDPGQIAELVESALPRIRKLSAKVELSALVGHVRESERLVPKDVSAVIDARVADEIRAAFDAGAIDETEEYAWVVSFPARMNLEPISLPDEPDMDFRIVYSAQRPDVDDDGQVVRTLDWTLVGAVYGSQETARVRVGRLCQEFDVVKWTDRQQTWAISDDRATSVIEVARRALGAND